MGSTAVQRAEGEPGMHGAARDLWGSEAHNAAGGGLQS